ncbi:MAG: hypothetical protein GEU26_16045 [Nitrososphaeraceae archaeon]|nr:hypothetical protein [Nitrososphaeraceae archaeon]
MNSTRQLNYKLQIIALVIAIMIGSAITETKVVIAQPNGNISRNNTTALGLGSDGENIVVTWLESNSCSNDQC